MVEMNIPKTVKIELLPSSKKMTCEKPAFWDYTTEWAKHHKTMWSLEGAFFFHGSAAEVNNLRQAMGNISGFQIKNLDLVVSKLLGGSWGTTCNFVVTPSGHIFVLTGGSVFYRTAVPFVTFTGMPDVAYRYLTDRHDDPIDELRHPCWALTQELVELLEIKLFPEGWKIARKEWLAEVKKSGAWEKAMEARKARKLATKTNRKMEVCMQAKTLIQDLEQYIKDINNGTATQAQVGQLYFSMNNLASLNKRLKSSFPKE